MRSERIREMILHPCNVAWRVSMRVDSYDEVLNVWEVYKKGEPLGLQGRDGRLIADLFKFHRDDMNHIILYYSAGKSNCLLMCRIGCEVVNTYIPADSIYSSERSVVATYS